MKKLLNIIEKNYICINITLLMLAIYVVLFPIISLAIEQINPNLVKCTYLTLTGKECPLCGGTRYIKNLGTIFKDITYIFNFFGAVIIAMLFNVIFRIRNIIKIKQNANMKTTMKLDFIIHIVLFFMYAIYEITFVIKN